MQADIYSFGILLYQLVTWGQTPYTEDFHNEMDRAVLTGLHLKPIISSGQHQWPDMENIIQACLKRVPENRPNVRDAFLEFQCISI